MFWTTLKTIHRGNVRAINTVVNNVIRTAMFAISVIPTIVVELRGYDYELVSSSMSRTRLHGLPTSVYVIIRACRCAWRDAKSVKAVSDSQYRELVELTASSIILNYLTHLTPVRLSQDYVYWSEVFNAFHNPDSCYYSSAHDTADDIVEAMDLRYPYESMLSYMLLSSHITIETYLSEITRARDLDGMLRLVRTFRFKTTLSMATSYGNDLDKLKVYSETYTDSHYDSIMQHCLNLTTIGTSRANCAKLIKGYK